MSGSDQFARIDDVLASALAKGVEWQLLRPRYTEGLRVRTTTGCCPLEVFADLGAGWIGRLDIHAMGLTQEDVNVIIMAADHSVAELCRRTELSDHKQDYHLAVAVRERMLQRFGLQEGAA